MGGKEKNKRMGGKEKTERMGGKEKSEGKRYYQGGRKGWTGSKSKD